MDFNFTEPLLIKYRSLWCITFYGIKFYGCSTNRKTVNLIPCKILIPYEVAYNASHLSKQHSYVSTNNILHCFRESSCSRLGGAKDSI